MPDAIQKKSEENTKAFEQTVSKALADATKTDTGLSFKEGTPEEVKYAAITENRRRETQSTYTKERQKSLELEAQNKVLTDQLNSMSTNASLSAEEQTELDTLKYQDPDAWRQKVNNHETAHLQEVKKKRTDALVEAQVAVQVELRKQTLEDFRTTNSDVDLSDDVLANEIPPRILKELESGKITFDVYLAKCANYIKSPKTLDPAELGSDPNLGSLAGGAEPTDAARAKSSVATYEDEVY